MRCATCVISAMLLVQPVEARQSIQAPTDAPSVTSPTDVPESIEEAESLWSFSISALAYISEENDYVQPTLAIDYDWLHLEARYNYEDLDTASLWIGYNFSIGEELTLDLTPMVGGVFGDTRGVAPGYEITLGWQKFELYTEGEYVLNTDDSSENFFYSWSEITYSPTDWCRAGIAAERTKIREESSEIEVGPMIGLTYESLDFSVYLLFPEEGDPTLALGFGIEF